MLREELVRLFKRETFQEFIVTKRCIENVGLMTYHGYIFSQHIKKSKKGSFKGCCWRDGRR